MNRTNKQRQNKRKQNKHRGVAMMLVVGLMAIAAIMAFAILSSSTMQAQSSSNSTSSSSADALAQSGTNLALYYLMYPDKASASVMSNSGTISFYNPGTNLPSFALSGDGSVDRIDVTNLGNHKFTVVVSSSAGPTSQRMSRKLTSTVQIVSRYVPKYAMASDGSFTIPSSLLFSTSINGDERNDSGLIGNNLSSIVTGQLYGNTTASPTFPVAATPTFAQLNLASTLAQNGTYVYNGGTYSAAALSPTYTGSSTTVNSTTPSLQGNTTTNPANVFYTSSKDITFNGTINFQGTLVLLNGRSLTIAGNNVTIAAKTGGITGSNVGNLPALIVNKDLVFSGLGRKLTINGVAYIGNSLTGSGGLSVGTMNVNGALMWASGGFIDTTKVIGSKLNITYPTPGVTWPATIESTIPDAIYVPNLSDYDQAPKTVKVLASSYQ